MCYKSFSAVKYDSRSYFIKLGNSSTVLFPGGIALPFLGVTVSVIRLGDLSDFGQLFKAFGNN